MRRKLEAIKSKSSGFSDSTAFAALRTSLNLFKEVAGKCGVPVLQEGVKALVILLDTLQVRTIRYRRSVCWLFVDVLDQKTAINMNDVESLTARIQSLTAMLGRAIKEGTLSPSLRDRVDRLAQYVSYLLMALILNKAIGHGYHRSKTCAPLLRKAISAAS
jgi:hypothetical protein